MFLKQSFVGREAIYIFLGTFLFIFVVHVYVSHCKFEKKKHILTIVSSATMLKAA